MPWLAQLVLPVVLLLLLAFRPERIRPIRLLQIGAIGAFLLALHFAGLWMIPPWWTPWVLWGLFALAASRGWRRPFKPASRTVDYLGAAVWLITLGVGGWLMQEAIRARTPPAGEIINLAMPFPIGQYYVANGGSDEIVNAHLRTLPRATTGQRNYWGQSYGIDIIATDHRGLTASQATPIMAPCYGRVVFARDGVADGSPVDFASPTARAGNFAILRCGAFDVALAHFRNGSLQVKPGDVVRKGQRIALMGSSGASDMPHLHIHAQRPGSAKAPFSGAPMPITINGRYLVRGDRP
jgi:murein DD-endopeptidase MepM/ murein hydrolase activator NlpD